MINFSIWSKFDSKIKREFLIQFWIDLVRAYWLKFDPKMKT